MGSEGMTRLMGMAERILGSRGLFVTELALIILLGAGLALWLVPEPHSDWGYYWNAAGEVGRYERGGLSLWLLAIPKILGWAPVPSALLLNLPSATVMLWLVRRADGSATRWFTFLAAAYLLLITPYMGIVQFDLIAATQLAAGFSLVLAPSTHLPRLLSLAFAVLMVVCGVSTKPQYALVIWALLGFHLVAYCLLGRRSRSWTPVLMGVLVLGSIGGFVVDSGLRAAGGRSEAIRTNSAVTLYGGLLVSSDGIGCGYWSVHAAESAKADLHKPLPQAVLDRLGEKPVSHWVSVVGCKLPQVVFPPPFALYWLVESPNIRAGINQDPHRESIDATYYRVLRWERKLYAALALAIMLTVAITCIRLRREGKLLSGMLAVLWIASFWAVHIVFEIQGRYFLGMFLLAPLLCALATRHASSSRSVVPDQGAAKPGDIPTALGADRKNERL